MRKRIYEIIEIGSKEDMPSRIYDWFMMAVIVISLVPLIFKQETMLFRVIDIVSAAIFIIDYVLRLLTADFKLMQGKKSFVRYPFTFMAIVDLVSVLPSFLAISPGFRVLKVFRLVRTFKVFRIFKGFRYSKNFNLIASVIKKQKDSLIAVCAVAVGYILIISLVMFNVEPETFNSFFDAIYWATISLTTMGYGDIYAVSAVGKVITMISALFGIAVVALPAGIISAGFMTELSKSKEETKEKDWQANHPGN